MTYHPPGQTPPPVPPWQNPKYVLPAIAVIVGWCVVCTAFGALHPPPATPAAPASATPAALPNSPPSGLTPPPPAGAAGPSPAVDAGPAAAPLTPGEHLAAARDGLVQPVPDFDAVLRHLDAIPARAREAREARPLRREAEAGRTHALAEIGNGAARGPAPLPSGWDGSYSVVNRYLAHALNDPGSYAHDVCGPPRAEGAVWLVNCRFRARNAMNALVAQEWVFFIQQGQVIRAHAVD